MYCSGVRVVALGRGGSLPCPRPAVRSRGVIRAAQNEQWWVGGELAVDLWPWRRERQHFELGVERRPGAAADAGSPWRRSSPTPLACSPASFCWSGSAWRGRARSAGRTGTGSPTSGLRSAADPAREVCGAESSSNSYANVGARRAVQRSTCRAGHAKFASETRTLSATSQRVGAERVLGRDRRRPGGGDAEDGGDHALVGVGGRRGRQTNMP